MKKNFLYILFFIISSFSFAQNWRSSLYPEYWIPGFKDSEGRFLHDFSYAGYHSGIKEIPKIKKNIIDITKQPYFADNSGKKDVTKIVQKAINTAKSQGGGVIYFPKGEYCLSIPDGKKEGILISSDNIVLRGDGADKTFLKNTTTSMRSKTLINFAANSGSWKSEGKISVSIIKDIVEPTCNIHVESVDGFKVNDLVLLHTDCTEEFIKEHKSENLWSEKIFGVTFCRNIVAIDIKNNILTIDAPTRYFMKVRDNARIYKLGKQLQECGIENLSIGNIQHPDKDNWNDDLAFNKQGTGAYEVHASHLITFLNSINCWAYNVHTYKPKENYDDIHVLSNCLLISYSRNVTVKKCNFKKSQYEGGGGNGYMFTLSDANDCLITECHAEHGRHNYDFKGFSSNGNVVHKCTSKDPRYSSDFHMFLSMANLIDCFESDGDYLDARFRPWGTKDFRHGYSTTETVFWNIKGKRPHNVGYLIESRQWKYGYVIGTSGPTNNVKTTPVSGEIEGYGIMYNFDTNPEDFLEGIGKGETLVPISLYEDQLKKRIKNNKIKY